MDQFSLDDLKGGVIESPSRVILSGMPKVGKTITAIDMRVNDLPPVYCQIAGEEGADDLDVEIRTPICQTWHDVMSLCSSICKFPRDQVGAIIFDQLGALQSLAEEDACQENDWSTINDKGLFGAGKKELNKRMRRLRNAMDAIRRQIGAWVICISHVKYRNVTPPHLGEQFDVWSLNLVDTVADDFTAWADCVAFAEAPYVVAKEKGNFGGEIKTVTDSGPRLLHVAPNPAYPSGGRGVFGEMESPIPLSGSGFLAEYERAKSRFQDGFQKRS